MAFELDGFYFLPGHGKTNSRDLIWSRMSLTFKDRELDPSHTPSIALSLLQTMRADTTIAELESAATDRAKSILRAALDALEANDVTTLLNKQVERDKADL
jgi:hypothetical protein